MAELLFATLDEGWFCPTWRTICHYEQGHFVKDFDGRQKICSHFWARVQIHERRYQYRIDTYEDILAKEKQEKFLQRIQKRRKRLK